LLISFSDRSKRLKLQQFLAKKADALYDKSNLIKSADSIKQEIGDEGIIFYLNNLNLVSKIKLGCSLSSEFYATMPGLDSFVAMEKSQRIRNFLEVFNKKLN
jgi:hypothetical protein